ncbi:probable nucleoredoxin 2 [Andrographis paniculata]|uniref:probable nucleoredoxin 2 n=1 Tax=Andrographis paniculata TaxID=175694 RepID=UPI0021E70510|nr:probable nucleoredoxin 2 [Andrographis paniculata]
MASHHSHLFSLLASQNRDFLLSPSGSQVKIGDLDGKILGIFFSANWDPPCREFTRALAAVYDNLKISDAGGFEVVFVSSDEDIEAFKTYFSAMPWLAIPFSDLEIKRALNERFDVEAIPSLVILQPDGGGATVVDGVDVIFRHGAEAYPFSEERMRELVEKEKDEHKNQSLESLLTNVNGRDYLIRHGSSQQVPISSLIGKTIGLYFSAQWCSPAVNFTPKLTSVYNKILQNHNETFEIVFVSNDHDQASFNSHLQAMPWLALPYGDANVRTLVRHFDVRRIPCLVILGPDGKTVSKDGRNLVSIYEEKAYPFTDHRTKELEKEAEEEAKNLPVSKVHWAHRHELSLAPMGGPYICCTCDEPGRGPAYGCIGCGYEVHPKCVMAKVVGIE